MEDDTKVRGMAREQRNEDGDIAFRRLDTDREEPAIEVSEIVAGLKGTEVSELPTVYGTIDHLLSHLFEDPPSADAQATVQFHYAGYQITVHQRGAATFLKLD